MKNPRRSLGILLAAAILSVAITNVIAATVPSAEEMEEAHRWIAAQFGSPVTTAGPPFSFVYGGQPSASFLKNWNVKREVRQIEGGRTQRTTTAQRRTSGCWSD